MPTYFIHIRDRDAFYADEEGVEASSIEEIEPHIRRVVSELVEDEEGWAVDDARVVEVTNEAGHMVLSVPFASMIWRN